VDPRAWQVDKIARGLGRFIDNLEVVQKALDAFSTQMVELEGIKVYMRKLHVVEMVVVAVRNFAMSAPVQSEGAYILGMFAVNDMPTQRVLLEQRAPELMHSALRFWRSDGDVLTSVCYAIEAMSTDFPAIQHEFGQMGAPGSLVDLMFQASSTSDAVLRDRAVGAFVGVVIDHTHNLLAVARNYDVNAILQVR
jgi:hypothetical protein